MLYNQIFIKPIFNWTKCYLKNIKEIEHRSLFNEMHNMETEPY